MGKFIERFDMFLDNRINTNPIKTLTLIGMVVGMAIVIFVGTDSMIMNALCNINPILGVIFSTITLGGSIGCILGITEL